MWPAKVVLESDQMGFFHTLRLSHTVPCLQMQRDSAKESVAEARENFNAAVNAFKAKQEEVEPLQKGRKDQNNMQRNVQAEFRDLEVRSEQELDTKVSFSIKSNMMHIATQTSTTSSALPSACCSNKISICTAFSYWDCTCPINQPRYDSVVELICTFLHQHLRKES